MLTHALHPFWLLLLPLLLLPLPARFSCHATSDATQLQL